MKSPSRHPYRGPAVLGLAAAALLIGPALAVQADPVADSATETTATAQADSRQSEQRPLVDAATVVRTAVESLGATGLASIVIEDKSVAVWWKGGEQALPSPVAAAVDRANRIAPVRVANAKYSKSDLLAASAKLESRLRANPSFHGIKARPDGSGLIVTSDAAIAETTDRGLPSVGVPTTVRVEERLRPVSRDDDSSPWSGGAQIINRTIGAGCTSGFGVNTPNGQAILTAGHCGEPGHRFTDGAGEFIGNVGPDDNTLDIQLIPTNAVSNRIYVGGANSTQQRTVTGGGAPFIGERLCQSGRTSANAVGGQICDLEVRFEHTDSQRLWEARQLQGQTAARPGDSGGPVYLDRGDGTVTARGTTTRVAGAGFGFAGFEKAQQKWNVSIPGGGGNPPPPPAGGVTFYNDCNYGATWKTLDVGSYVVQSANDLISSLKVPAGYRVTLYDANNHTGPSITKTADDGCLVDDGWNDRVSSLRIERG